MNCACGCSVALLLDLLGQVLIVTLIPCDHDWTGIDFSGRSLVGQEYWLVLMLLLYPLLGWLFGSYTVLRWRRLPMTVLLQRLFITAVATDGGSYCTLADQPQ